MFLAWIGDILWMTRRCVCGVAGLRAAVVVVAASVGLLGCPRYGAEVFLCAGADDPSADCPGEELGSAGTTAPPADCLAGGGSCVEQAPDGASGPHLYWIGPESEEPDCPTVAPMPGNEAHADLGPLVHTCPKCACGPSETKCLPSTSWT